MNVAGQGHLNGTKRDGTGLEIITGIGTNLNTVVIAANGAGRGRGLLEETVEDGEMVTTGTQIGDIQGRGQSSTTAIETTNVGRLHGEA